MILRELLRSLSLCYVFASRILVVALNGFRHFSSGRLLADIVHWCWFFEISLLNNNYQIKIRSKGLTDHNWFKLFHRLHYSLLILMLGITLFRYVMLVLNSRAFVNKWGKWDVSMSWEMIVTNSFLGGGEFPCKPLRYTGFIRLGSCALFFLCHNNTSV